MKKFNREEFTSKKINGIGKNSGENLNVNENKELKVKIFNVKII